MKSLGPKGEDTAVGYLKDKGYSILHRNFRTPLGEADIIVKDKEELVFVEVKARSSDCFGQPFEAVGHRKQEKLKKIALYYIKHTRTESPVRVDVISIITKDGKEEINHIKEAF